MVSKRIVLLSGIAIAAMAAHTTVFATPKDIEVTSWDAVEMCTEEENNLRIVNEYIKYIKAGGTYNPTAVIARTRARREYMECFEEHMFPDEEEEEEE
ncbi:hypothetical protein VPHK479_0096 [Vibrio phage K479]